MQEYYTFGLKMAKDRRAGLARVQSPVLRRRPDGVLSDAGPDEERKPRYAEFKDGAGIKADEAVDIIGVSPTHVLVRTRGPLPTLLSVPLDQFILHFVKEERL